MATKTSPVILADQLVTVVLEVRAFGEANSPYITRLVTEINNKGWRMNHKRIEKIHEELDQRANQIQTLVMKLEATLNDFGRIQPHEKNILHRYWSEAANVRRLFDEGTQQVRSLIGCTKPALATRGTGSL